MRLITNNIIIKSLTNTFRVIPPQFKGKSVWMLLLLMLNSVLELVGLAALIPVFTLVLKEGIIQENDILRNLYEMSGLSTEYQFIILACAIVIVLFILKNILSLLIIRTQANFSYSIYVNLGSRLQRYFYSKGLAYFKDTNANVIARDINFISLSFSQNLLLPLFNFLNEIIILLLIVVGILLYNAQVMVLLAVVVGPAFFLFYYLVRKRIQYLNDRRKDLGAELALSLYQSIYGYMDIVVGNKQEWFFREYKKKQEETKTIQRDLHVFSMAPTKVIESAMIVGIFCILIYGLSVMGDISELTLMLGIFAVSAYRILPSINRIMVALMSIKGFQYVFDVLNQLIDVKPTGESDKELKFEKEIEIKDLTFAYSDDGKQVLKGIDIVIPHQKIVGIIGKSGSGKTTLINILLRFLQETGGEIMVDGKKLENRHLLAWRDLIGYVPQDVYIAEGDIRSNIAFGADLIDEKKLARSVKLASLQDLIEELPEGMNTAIGERGARISGGQRQRIGIARALYSGAQILVMDEATSALDFDTEMEIADSIKSLRDNGYTIIAISHRLSMLKHSDFIIEIADGKILRTNLYENLINDYA